MRVAIIGCGQLARMLALSGISQGITFSFLADSSLVDKGEAVDVSCVDGLGTIVTFKPEFTGKQLFELLQKPDVITFEKEQVNIADIESLNAYCKILPSLDALSVCQCRRREKEFLQDNDIPTARYVFINSPEKLLTCMEGFTTPVYIKSIRQGYDGKNQWRASNATALSAIPADVVSDGVIVEEAIPYIKEVSLVSARSQTGQIKHYPITENVHKNSILIHSMAPEQDMSRSLREAAQEYMQRILETLDYVGVMAMELFVTADGILVNELAPRVHNSGHWTQNGAVTCQFENHIRAVTGQVLGSTEIHGFAGMMNILGTEACQDRALTEHSKFHWYNKAHKLGRKLGHVNFVCHSYSGLKAMMNEYQ